MDCNKITKTTTKILALFLVVSFATTMFSMPSMMGAANAQTLPPGSLSCEPDLKLVQGMCIGYRTTEPEKICNQGEYNEGTGECELITGEQPTLICQPGYVLNKANECIDLETGQIGPEPTPTCNQGRYDPDRQTCVLTTGEPTLICSQGTLNEEKKCEILVQQRPGLALEGQVTNYCYNVAIPGEAPSGNCSSTIEQCQQEQRSDPYAISGCYPHNKESNR